MREKFAWMSEGQLRPESIEGRLDAVWDLESTEDVAPFVRDLASSLIAMPTSGKSASGPARHPS